MELNLQLADHASLAAAERHFLEPSKDCCMVCSVEGLPSKAILVLVRPGMYTIECTFGHSTFMYCSAAEAWEGWRTYALCQTPDDLGHVVVRVKHHRLL